MGQFREVNLLKIDCVRDNPLFLSEYLYKNYIISWITRNYNDYFLGHFTNFGSFIQY
jgi:hypothetical protein